MCMFFRLRLIMGGFGQVLVGHIIPQLEPGSTFDRSS
jgi:hypothetical protein